MDLGLKKRELVLLMGYSNVSKGLRRLEAILNGDIGIARQLRLELAEGLGMDIADIDLAINAEAMEKQKSAEALYRQVFRPHAVILTSQKIPSPIFAYAMARVDRRLRIDFVEGTSPLTYVIQARKKLPPGVPTLGRTTGFVVNYAPDRAVEFDLRGRPVATLDRAVRIGYATITARGRPIDIL